MSISIKSILRDYRHYRYFVPAALALLLGLALLGQTVSADASASVAGLNQRSLKTGNSYPINAAPQTTDTPTPTSTPTTVLVGHLIGSARRHPITLTLMMGPTQIIYPSQNPDASGFFTVSVDGLASGTYDYRAKGLNTLAVVGTVTLTGGPTTQLEIGGLFGGDCNDNNIVDAPDIAIFKSAFGSSCGDPLYDRRADFNNSCIVNTTDIFELNNYFNFMGAPPDSPVPPSIGDAFLVLQPGSAGNCAAPVNGGTVQLGCRFVLDLMVNTGSITNTVAQESYLTFTNSIIQNARTNSIAGSCTLTSTVTSDTQSFDLALHGEVCNGPGPCVFHGTPVVPGSLAQASGALSNSNCPAGCGGVFRVAQIGLCAVAPGQAVLRWQFSPPAARNRHTEIVDVSSNLVQGQASFTDYVFEVIDPTATPTATSTATPTPGLLGHAIWEGRQPQPHPSQMLPISLTLRLTTGGPYYDYPLQTTDASGLFTVSVAGLPDGTYNWRVKGSKYLAASGSVTLDGSPLVQFDALMKVGDANNDNLVNSIDFTLLRNTFGKGCGDPGYDDRADFNGDCLVNATDFTLLRNNFGLGGAPPISPGGP